MQQLYNVLNVNAGISEVLKWIENATRERGTDIEDYNNQIISNPVIFPVPASSSDITGTEKAGDIAVSASHFYIVADNAGVLVWRRVAISSF